MKISFILYVFQFFIKNQHLTSHGIMYVFVDFRKKKVKKIVQNEIAMRNVSTTRETGILYALLKKVHYSKTYI